VKAVLRLVMVYFTGTPVQRWMSILTLILLALGILGLRKYSALVFVGPKIQISNGSIAFSALVWMVPILAVLTLFFSAALMPLVFGHLARTKHLHVLPYARSRLLISIILVLGMVAILFAGVVEALYASFPVDQGAVFGKAMAIAVLTFSPMYVFVWLISRTKGALGSLGGAMLIIPCLALPFHFVQIPQPPLRLPVAIGGVIFVACAGAFLLAPSWRGWLPSEAPKWRIPRPQIQSEYRPGRELALLVGVARPWMLSVWLIFPVGVATLFITSANIWLCYFVLCTVICGGISSLSVSRSRSLWLRGPWSRSQLLAHLEALHWRQNAYCVSVLEVLLVAIGSYLGFRTKLLAIGIPLLLAGAAVGTYLGLMMTRGIGWLDAMCAAGTMLLMLAIALYAVDMPITVLIGLGAAVIGLSIAFRTLAQRRWRQLDWVLCRAPAQRDSQSL
jgi:hypothetical protein